MLIGLGTAGAVDRIRVRWPSGAETTLDHPEIDRTTQVTEPKGMP